MVNNLSKEEAYKTLNEIVKKAVLLSPIFGARVSSIYGDNGNLSMAVKTLFGAELIEINYCAANGRPSFANIRVFNRCSQNLRYGIEVGLRGMGVELNVLD